MTFFWCKFGFEKCFGASSWSSHWAGHHWLSYKVLFSSQVTIKSRNVSLLLHRIRKGDASSQWFFLTFCQLMRYLLIKLYHFSSLLQMSNDCRMVHIEFFGNFSRSCKRISFHGCSQVVTVNFWLVATALLIFKALISFAKLLEPPLPWTFLAVLEPNVLLILPHTRKKGEK